MERVGGIALAGPDIFISYSREDRAAARHFAECFAREGFDVWWDAALHSGEAFDQVIENELKAAKAVVVLWSPRSVTSRWVRAEATLADRRHKLAPVIIEPCDRPIIFELMHTADLSDWTGDQDDPRWKAFIRDLHRLVQRNSAGTEAHEVRHVGPGPAARSESSPPVAHQPASPSAINPAQRPNGGRPAARDIDAEEDLDRTQFYTRGDGVDGVETEIHCLELVAEGEMQQRFIVSPPGLKVGRSAPADIVLADPRVSRSHCRIEFDGGELRVVDLNSTNGTFIDGERIADSAVLEIGSVLRVGNVCFSHEVRARADV